jgi:hypothetical protein
VTVCANVSEFDLIKLISLLILMDLIEFSDSLVNSCEFSGSLVNFRNFSEICDCL